MASAFVQAATQLLRALSPTPGFSENATDIYSQGEQRTTTLILTVRDSR